MLLKQARPPEPDGPPDLLALMTRCWAQAPDARPAFAEVKAALAKGQSSGRELVEVLAAPLEKEIAPAVAASPELAAVPELAASPSTESLPEAAVAPASA